ncbi:MAG: hypothetical protein HDR00_05560 [Lachnospiraceae bacterium]|nr:hypothetical protein [Lachnospiraceae bacterium]
MDKKLMYDKKINNLFIRGALLNGAWFSEFGQVQSELLKTYNTKIVVDMQECYFVSPTPFLSLLLTLKKLYHENKCLLDIILPNDDTLEKQKFLNYCAREGFIDIINSISEKKYDVSKMNSYNVIGNENFEKIYKACIIELEQNENRVKEIVDKIIDEINENNLNINKGSKLYLMITIRNILQELIDNVDKHAYNQGKKFFSLYIRMRYSNDSTIRIGKENNLYGNLKTTTKPDEIYVHKGIEIYFQDIGKGIIKSYEEKGGVYPNRPLREIVKEAFFKENFENRANNTPVNGLAFLRKIIEEKNNFFCVYNQEEGTGNFGINDMKTNINNIHMGDLGGEDHISGIKGQIYNFTLFDREFLKQKQEQQGSFEGLLETYIRPYQNTSMEVLDLREEVKGFRISGLKSEVILFVPKYLTKNLIITTLENVFTNSDGIRRLIVADIEDEELVLFEFALKNLFASRIDNKNYLSELYIVTKSLRVICFKPIDVGLKLVQTQITFLEFNSKFDYLYKIKSYESKYLAKFLENNAVGKYVLTPGKIEWEDDEIINGFINFDMMASNDFCFDLLQRNLKRFLPIIGKKRLYAIDSVVERVVGTVNTFTDEESNERFGVGSIIVSGLTLQSSDYTGNTIHFFSRSSKKRRAALFFDPIYLYKSEQEKVYVRDGNTSRIRLKSAKKRKRCSNSYLEEQETYKILHQFAYSSVLCGHLCFEKRHDLLSINLNAIMYDKDTSLHTFIEKTIKYALGHYCMEILQEDSFFDVLKDACLIVYPYNQLTSSILKMSNIAQKYSRYIVGLSPTNITHQGENLEYSECFTEYIKEILEEFKNTHKNEQLKVVIFDTLSYSGKTKQEIYEYINSIEEIKPYYVNIIDAKVNHYTKQINDLNYMNLNIPLLGKSESCKICLVLNKLSALKNNIIDANILASIENMEKVWRVRDIRNYGEIIKLSNFDRVYANKIITNDIGGENDEELYFVNALPLYIFITNRIKLENDYSSIEFVIDNFKDVIGSDSLSYITSLFLFEYGENVYHSLLVKIIKLLLEYLINSTELNIRQFVVLALLSISDEKLIENVFEFVSDNETSIQLRYEGQIVLLYCLNREHIKKSNTKIMFLYNKMKSGNNRLDLYKQFHCQLKNTNGNVHNSPLKSLINGQANIANRRLTLASLSLLEESLKCSELAFDILYEEGRDSGQEKNVIEEIDISFVREKCLDDIKQIKAEIGKMSHEKYIKEKLVEVFNAGEEIHKRLFAPFVITANPENRKLKSIVTLLAERVEIYNKAIEKDIETFPISLDESYDSKISVSGNIVTIYYIWNNMLVREIDYVLDNVGKFVKDSQTVVIEGQKMSGEIRIKITSSEFIISIFNNTTESIENIEKKAKQRYQKEVLNLLGVRFEYCKNGEENNIFDSEAVITKIVIPNIQNVKE